MNIAVRYFTRTGNTKEFAVAAAEVLETEALDVTERLAGKKDILFLCDSVNYAGVNGAVKSFMKVNRDNISRLVNILMAALIESSYPQIRRICESLGIEIESREFHCKGSFMEVHKGHLDMDDIEGLKGFVREIIDGTDK